MITAKPWTFRECLVNSVWKSDQNAAHIIVNAGGAKKRAVKLTGESKVFEEGQLGEAPGGGNLTTYKELSALATEMGQPDLLYKFMDLANHASAMASTRGAAFGCVQTLLACMDYSYLP
jgi:proteasome component ECM29